MRRILFPALLLCAAAMPAHETHELRGTVELMQDGRRLAQGTQEAVVYFTPARGGAKATAGKPVEMVTVRKEFKPRVLIVPVGTTVRFPNQDPILHNVFSVSGGNAFDVGLYGKGAGKETTFRNAGLVRVFCNVHQSMTAYILVLGTSYSATPDAKGSFRLAGLPSGPGTVSVWHERGELLNQQVTLPVTAPLRLAVPVSKPRVPRHLNKFGKPYRADNAYR
jgi:plastocyanin